MVLYHVWPRWFPGGFVGVDVFFVVSGFLITGNMVRETERTGRLSLRTFWSNRVRRILPAGLTAIAVTAFASTWLLPLSRLTQVSTHALASAFYVQNWVLAHESIDYLAQTNPETPFEHYWSLAVEEQFYLLWPLVVVGVVALAGRASVRRGLGIAFGILVGVSFVWSVVAVSQGDPSAYFATTTRLWELGAGALLAVLSRTWTLPDRVRTGSAVSSLVVIAAAVMLIQPSYPFPGLLALAPVVGAALMVVAGPIPPQSRSLSAVLGWRPVQWLGNISYSLYLWHFPPIVVYVAIVGSMPGLGAGLALALFSVGLAALSYYVVEQPARKSNWLKAGRYRALLCGLVALLVTAAVSCIPLIPVRLHLEEVADARETPLPTARRGANAFDLTRLSATDDPSFSAPDRPILPDPIGELALPVFPGHTYYACHVSRDETSPACSYGPADATRVIAIVGDSNSAQYLPALLRLADAHQWRLVLLTRSECPFTPDLVPSSANNSACPEQNKLLLDYLTNDLRPDAVFTAASSSYTFRDTDGQPAGAAGFADYWNRLLGAGIKVVAVRPIPRPVADPVECVVKHLEDPLQCAEPREQDLSPNVATLYDHAFELSPGTVNLDLGSKVCSPGRCYQVLGNTLVYRDRAHLSVEFVETLTDTLDAALS